MPELAAVAGVAVLRGRRARCATGRVEKSNANLLVWCPGERNGSVDVDREFVQFLGPVMDEVPVAGVAEHARLAARARLGAAVIETSVILHWS